MQTLDDKHYVELEILARKRGITLQQFVRAIVIPEWMDGRGPQRLSDAHKRMRGRRGHRKLVSALTA